MAATKPKVLIVDDKPNNLYALEKTLQKLPVDVVQASSGGEALNLTLEHEFAMAIVDVQMPEMDGYELVELLRANIATSSLPVVFVSAIFSDEYHHRKGYDSGAVDFMSKPFIPEILLSKVKVFIDLYEQRRQLQSTVDDLDQAYGALSRRTMLLETSNRLGQQITNILDMKDLLPQVTQIIQSQFNYAWLSIWLVDDERANLTLEARTSSMVELNTQIPITHRGLVAQACRTGEAAFDNKAGQNSNFTATPGLRACFSELAIPLKYCNDTLGVLDIQSERFQAFNPSDVDALKLLSVQVAVAVLNARLHHELHRLNPESRLVNPNKK